MRPVCEAFQNDLDIVTLFADALMNVTPWALWDLETGEPNPKAHTLEAKEVLEHALATNPDAIRHPGLAHMYIHLMEMSNTPEAAMPAANHLRNATPGSGHNNHMPSHLDVLVGDVVGQRRRRVHVERPLLLRAVEGGRPPHVAPCRQGDADRPAGDQDGLAG